MRLTHMHPGDIVRVDDGLPYYAVVVAKERGRLRVRALGRRIAPRLVKAAWVVDHWRHARRSRATVPIDPS
jgi:hypothetical protein